MLKLFFYPTLTKHMHLHKQRGIVQKHIDNTAELKLSRDKTQEKLTQSLYENDRLVSVHILPNVITHSFM